jgi:hypothetical protein
MVVVTARQATQAGGIDSFESILGLLKSLKIRVQGTNALVNISPQDWNLVPLPPPPPRWLDWLCFCVLYMPFTVTMYMNLTVSEGV